MGLEPVKKDAVQSELQLQELLAKAETGHIDTTIQAIAKAIPDLIPTTEAEFKLIARLQAIYTTFKSLEPGKPRSSILPAGWEIVGLSALPGHRKLGDSITTCRDLGKAIDDLYDTLLHLDGSQDLEGIKQGLQTELGRIEGALRAMPEELRNKVPRMDLFIKIKLEECRNLRAIVEGDTLAAFHTLPDLTEAPSPTKPVEKSAVEFLKIKVRNDAEKGAQLTPLEVALWKRAQKAEKASDLEQMGDFRTLHRALIKRIAYIEKYPPADGGRERDAILNIIANLSLSSQCAPSDKVITDFFKKYEEEFLEKTTGSTFQQIMYDQLFGIRDEVRMGLGLAEGPQTSPREKLLLRFLDACQKNETENAVQAFIAVANDPEFTANKLLKEQLMHLIHGMNSDQIVQFVQQMQNHKIGIPVLQKLLPELKEELQLAHFCLLSEQTRDGKKGMTMKNGEFILSPTALKERATCEQFVKAIEKYLNSNIECFTLRGQLVGKLFTQLPKNKFLSQFGELGPFREKCLEYAKQDFLKDTFPFTIPDTEEAYDKRTAPLRALHLEPLWGAFASGMAPTAYFEHFILSLLCNSKNPDESLMSGNQFLKSLIQNLPGPPSAIHVHHCIMAAHFLVKNHLLHPQDPVLQELESSVIKMRPKTFETPSYWPNLATQRDCLDAIAKIRSEPIAPKLTLTEEQKNQMGLFLDYNNRGALPQEDDFADALEAAYRVASQNNNIRDLQDAKSQTAIEKLAQQFTTLTAQGIPDENKKRKLQQFVASVCKKLTNKGTVNALNAAYDLYQVFLTDEISGDKVVIRGQNQSVGTKPLTYRDFLEEEKGFERNRIMAQHNLPPFYVDNRRFYLRANEYTVQQDHLTYAQLPQVSKQVQSYLAPAVP